MARFSAFKGSQLELDDERSEARWQGQYLELSRESFLILQTLAREPGKLFLPHELIDVLIDAARTDGDYSKLDLVGHIKEIQFSFSPVCGNRGFIETVPRRGYRWSEPKPSALNTLLGIVR